jgi:hypothetical protein
MIEDKINFFIFTPCNYNPNPRRGASQDRTLFVKVILVRFYFIFIFKRLTKYGARLTRPKLRLSPYFSRKQTLYRPLLLQSFHFYPASRNPSVKLLKQQPKQHDTGVRMGKNLFFTATLFVSLSAFSSPQNGAKNFTYLGRVGKLVLSALKSADVEATCSKNGCKYAIADFYSAEETDGCGGGTTSYETSFIYSDLTAYNFKTCDGLEDQSARRALTNKGDALNKVLAELDFFKTSGWVSSADIQKIECYSDSRNNFSSCVIIPR